MSTPRGPELDAQVRDAAAPACPWCTQWNSIGEACEEHRKALDPPATWAEAFRAPEPDEVERVARHHWNTQGPDEAGFRALVDVLRAAEARGRERGLEEAARACAAEIASYDSGTHEYFTLGAQGCISRILALQVKR